MVTIMTKARTRADGNLTVSVPTHLRDIDVDVVITVDAVPAQADVDHAPAYPPGFFEATFGGIPALERLPQGGADTRDPLGC